MPSRSHWIRAVLLISLVQVFFSCNNNKPETHITTPYLMVTPVGFPGMEIPEDNPMTVEAVELGKKLFFDPILSGDYAVSCASCHIPSRAFADTVSVSIGVHKDRMGKRNSYSLANVGYLDALFMEGGVPSLELQVLAPLGEKSEMDLQLTEAVKRMTEDPEYVKMSKAAYDREIDVWLITHALAAFQRSLVSGDSPFDRFYYSKVQNAISEEAKEGWEVFQKKGCNACHSGYLFSNQGYFNIGLYEEYADPGRGRLTDDPNDHGKFRVPSLRNVALTGPYMHNGSLKTLDEVIDHFSSGGKSHPNKSPLISGFEITEKERSQLLAFLNSLTDHSFVKNKEHLPLP